VLILGLAWLTDCVWQRCVPSSSVQRLLERLYPHRVMLGHEGQIAVDSALKVYQLLVCSGCWVFS